MAIKPVYLILGMSIELVIAHLTLEPRTLKDITTFGSAIVNERAICQCN